MPDDIIVCPSCNRKLRMAETHQGQIVQCPLCSGIFRTPVRAEPPGGAPPPAETAPPGTLPPNTIGPPARPAGPTVQPSQPLSPSGELQQPTIDVQRALLLPGTSLLISGVMSAIVGAVSLRDTVTRGPDGMVAFLKEMFSEDVVRSLTAGASPDQVYRSFLMANGLALFVTLGVILGAVHMLRLQRYRLAVFGSLLACVNFASLPGTVSCCFFTAPMGLWALMVLRLPEVRSAFDAPPEPESESDSDPSDSE